MVRLLCSSCARQANRHFALLLPAGRNVDKHDYSPATAALGAEWRDGMKRLEAMGDALADRAAKRRNPALADCLTLAVASWHSRRADRECVRAVLAVAGIDMTDAGRGAAQKRWTPVMAGALTSWANDTTPRLRSAS